MTNSSCNRICVLTLKVIDGGMGPDTCVRTGSEWNPCRRQGPRTPPWKSAPMLLPARQQYISNVVDVPQESHGLNVLVLCLETRFRAHPLVSTGSAEPLLNSPTYHTASLQFRPPQCVDGAGTSRSGFNSDMASSASLDCLRCQVLAHGDLERQM